LLVDHPKDTALGAVYPLLLLSTALTPGPLFGANVSVVAQPALGSGLAGMPGDNK
jgi:hypothetical protein